MKPAYLIAGDDEAKLAATLARLRARAEREGGPGALESFEGTGGAPDVERLAAAIPALSLMAERRYMLADGVERWNASQVKRLAAALAEAPGEVTVVMLYRREAKKVPKGLSKAVREAGGEILEFDAPRRAELARWVAGEARARGLALDQHAARALIARVGERTGRLASELDRLATWAGPGGEPLDAARIEELTSDGSEVRVWALEDAIVARDPVRAVDAAEALLAQGVDVTPLVYSAAKKLRAAHLAAAALERGEPAGRIEPELPMHPYAAKLLVRAVRGADPAELAAAIEAIADLEWWTRGGSDYGDAVALTLAARRAAGGAA